MGGQLRFSVQFHVFFNVLILGGITPWSRAQVPTQELETRLQLDSTQRLEVQIGTVGFVKNNEYFNPHAEGYTLWGVQLAPALVYRLAPGALLRAGLFWRNDFGAHPKAAPEPMLTLKLSHHNWHYLFGTLEGNLNHRLVEPLYNYERYLRSPIENGLQVNHRGRKHFFDFWISYPQNTLPGYHRQEHFWGGVSTCFKLAGFRTGSLEGIGQATAFHAGGQGIRSSLPVRTALNTALGIRASYRPGGTLVRSVEMAPYWLGYLENAATSSSGSAWYLNGTVEFSFLTLMLSYWLANGYRTEYGGDLFISDSRSVVNPAYVEKQREWLMLRFIKTLPLGEGLVLSFRFEPTLDLNRKKLDHSEGIYFSYVLREKLLKKH